MAAPICSRAAAAGWTSRTSTYLLHFSSMLSIRVTGASLACSSRRRWKHCYSGMYSRVSSMLRGSGRMIQRAATTTGSLPLSKSLLRTLLKRVSVSRRKVASFLAGTRNQSGHLTEFCRKCSLCFRSTAVSWSGNPAFSIKEIPRDSRSSTRLGTHRYSGDDSQSGRGTQANTYSDRTRPQGASSDPGEGARHGTSCLGAGRSGQSDRGGRGMERRACTRARYGVLDNPPECKGRSFVTAHRAYNKGWARPDSRSAATALEGISVTKGWPFSDTEQHPLTRARARTAAKSSHMPRSSSRAAARPDQPNRLGRYS